MHAQDLLPPGEIGRRDQHLPVEAARAQERRVEVLEPVRGAHDHDLVALGEAVQLDEQLIQGLVVLAVEAVPAARHAHRIELVDEDHRRRILARLLEELPDPCGAETREHLDERRRARRVEVRARLVCRRLREQRLARTGRPVQQQALRHACTELREPLRIPEELDDLEQFGLRLVEAGDLVEARARRARLDLGRLHARHQRQHAPEEIQHQRVDDGRHHLVKRPPPARRQAARPRRGAVRAGTCAARSRRLTR